MNYCTNCGNKIDGNAYVCVHCGVKLQNEVVSQANDEGGFCWSILGFFIPIAGLVLYLVWKNEKPKTAKAAGKGALVYIIFYILFLIILFGFAFASASEDYNEDYHNNGYNYNFE